MNARILVVEDNNSIRKGIVRILSQKGGFDVEEAQDGAIGVEKIRSFKPHLVLLDVVMPVMDGFEVLQIVRKEFSSMELPIILVTAMQDSEDIVKGFELGANDYLPKAFNQAELFARVYNFLQMRDYHLQLKERNLIMERDLDISRLIQEKLLPEKNPSIPGFQIQSLYVPMDKIGGDYYDFFPGKDSLDIFIADVSGHGVPGAFIASVLKMTSHYLHDSEGSLNNLMTRMDRAVFERGALGMFATAFLVRIFFGEGKIQYCNAGHCPLLIHRRSTSEFIELVTPGAPLGINFDLKKGVAFKVGEFHLKPQDRLILYTDGIIETTNKNFEPFEEFGWKAFLNEVSKDPLQSLSKSLITKLKSYSEKELFEDDLTWVILDYEG